MSSKVYFTDFRCKGSDSRLAKLERLIKAAGIDQIDFQDKYVAVKVHFGEWGNMAFLRQQYAKVVCDYVKSKGGKPFLTDCNTLYPGYRHNALDHLDCAYMNGYNPWPPVSIPSSPTVSAVLTSALFLSKALNMSRKPRSAPPLRKQM